EMCIRDSSKGLGDPRLDRIAERLVEYNVLYPCRMAGEEAYLPQLPIYAPAIRLAAEKKLDRTSRIPPDTLKELAERNEWSRSRCMGALQIV
ncbi:MAG: hypothetical protein F7B17_00025, partial [Desulfurococcales archaeon]|nr:hypothetical protein [Desulfurococcales archaeon]